MDYYFYNTDSWSFEGDHHIRTLIDQHLAVTGGPRRFGDQLRQLKKEDILLMYHNRRGVVAVGEVLERWDGKAYRQPVYYPDLKHLEREYRIGVNWLHNLTTNPITLAKLRKLIGSPGFTPRGAVRPIVKIRPAIERLVAEVQRHRLPTPQASDLTPPERVETTTYRILRDTAIAISVKKLHNYQCQICGHTIMFSDGQRYAEAHHIRPLGREHKGPDVKHNVLCLCPNHHAELDLGVSAIVLSALRQRNGHSIDPQYIEYHNTFIYKSKSDSIC